MQNDEPSGPSARMYGEIFNSAPLAMFIVDRNFLILDANKRFRELYPLYDDNRNAPCYGIIPRDGRDMPCPECNVRKAFISGAPSSGEEESTRDGRPVHYRKEASPIFNERGEVTAVMEIIEDITDRVESERKLENYNRELELAINGRIAEQRLKEKKLTVLINTVYEIKGARNLDESIDKIICGFKELEARAVAFSLIDADDMHLIRVYPRDVLQRLEAIFHIDPARFRVNPVKNPENPLVHAVLLGKPVFARGEKDIFTFFKSCFPRSFDDEIAEAAYLFRDQSQVIFPLKAKDSSIGAIALFAENPVLEQNFEYYSFLANSAAMEISRQINSEKLLKSELKYRLLVESSRDMIILCAGDGRIRFSNRIFTELTGIAAARKKEVSIYTLFRGLSRDKVREILSSGNSAGPPVEPMEIKLKTPGNRELWTEMIINAVPGEERGFQVVARDITHRKNLELLIGNMSGFQEKILQNDFIGIVTTDLSGVITSWNKGAAHILGFVPDETLRKNISSFVIMDGGETYRQFMKRDVTASAQLSRELTFKRKNGEPVNVMYVESTMKDEASQPIAVIAFFFDITEKVRLEEQWKDLTWRLQQAQLTTILSLAKLAEYRDIETGHHLERIMKYTEILANELAGFKEYRNYISGEYITDLVNSCPLHDIGKVGIPDMILHKPGRLSPEECDIIKKHTVIGGDTIAEAERKVKGRSYLNLGKEIAYYHHERWDGTGYPKGLRDKQIPLSARIVAVADVYDALISKRPYKEPFPHETAMNIITGSSGTHFDESVVRAMENREQAFLELRNGYLQ